MPTRFLVPLIAALAFLARPAGVAVAAEYRVLFGTHSAGPGRGFSVARFDSDTGALSKPQLVIRSDAPAYFVVAPGGRHLYTCNSVPNFGGEAHTGGISAFALDAAGAGTLTPVNAQPSGGEDPSYVSLDRSGKFALVANYGGNRVPGQGGTIAVFPINDDGSLGPRTAFAQHAGTSVDPARQKQAYAHAIVTDPANRFALVPDLGLDRVFVYRFDAAAGTLAPNDPPFVAVKPGSGPRHLEFGPGGKIVYVVHEMGSFVTAFHWDAGRGTLDPFQEISTLPPAFTGASTCAEVRASPDGRFLYASNRGHDSVAQFTIDPATGGLAFVGTVPSGGKTPRNFEFDPTGRWMLVTNHGSNNATVLAIDPATGRLKQAGDPVAVDSPFCPRFLPVPNPVPKP